MNMQTLNVWAILVAALSAFLLGGLWYSPALFHNAWKRANGFGKDEPPPDSPAKVFGISFIFSLIMSFNLAMFLNAPKTDMAWGATAAAAVLLGVAFDPNFANNSFVYAYYTVPGASAHNRISRFTANGDVMLAASEHPAFSEGRRTVLSGLRILAVSAMNFTPQKTMMSLSVVAALRLSSKESPTKSGMV